MSHCFDNEGVVIDCNSINKSTLILFREVSNRQLAAKIQPCVLVSVFRRPCKLACKLMRLSRLITPEHQKLFNTHVLIEELEGIQTRPMSCERKACIFVSCTTQGDNMLKTMFGHKQLKIWLIAHLSRPLSNRPRTDRRLSRGRVHVCEPYIAPFRRVLTRVWNKGEWSNRQQEIDLKFHLQIRSEA